MSLYPPITETAIPTDATIPSTTIFTPTLVVSSITATPSATLTGTNTATFTLSPTETATDTTTATRTITRTLIPPQIVSFRLIDANTDQEVLTLEDGMIVNMPDYGIVAFNIRIVTSGSVGSVRIDWTSITTRYENGAPWALFGDISGDYYGMPVTAGLYSLMAQPFSGGNGSGVAGQAVTIWLSIANSEANRPIMPIATLQGNVPAPSDYFCNAQWLMVNDKCS